MNGVEIRTMREGDLAEADRIFRLAFGTFLKMPDPMQFAGDADFVRTRQAVWPEAAFVAQWRGAVVGSILSVRRGSVAFFGPLTIRPDLWDAGIGKRLVAATVELYERWGIRHAGLFTFSDSAKHVALYQKLGFWPVSLMALMARPVDRAAGAAAPQASIGALPAAERARAVEACRALAGTIYPGLDASDEIEAMARRGIGDVALVRDRDGVQAFAVCHAGSGSEAGSGTCLAKFGVVAPGPAAAAGFDRLIDACSTVAARCGAGMLLAGVDLGCRAPYRRLLERGFRTQIQGVAMHRPDGPGYFAPDAYVLDDWR
jgi:predicted N-acetyltransferase YhbS